MSELLIIIITLVLTFYFSGTETAFISVNRVRIELWRRQKSGAGMLIAKFLQTPERFIYTTLVGNNIANIAFASYATIYLHRHLSDSLTWLIVTIITVFWGEIIPKTLFRSQADWIIRKVAHILQFFFIILYPMIWVVSRISEWILKAMNHSADEITDFFSNKDVEILIQESEVRVNIDKIESEILGRVLQLRHLLVRDAMIPRTDIVSVPESVSIEDLIDVFKKSGFTKIPVCRQDLDDIIGVVILKDLFQQPETVGEIIRDVMFVPDTKRSTELLREFRQTKSTLAIVINEYGGTAGLVTTEDLIEELVGEIVDEYDETEIFIRKMEEGVYSVNARTEVEMLKDKVGIELPEGEFETVGGFILNHLGHIPHRAESFEYRGIKFIITKATRRKVEWVRIILPN